MLALTGQILCGLSLGMLSSFVVGASSVGLWTLAWPWILGIGLIGAVLFVLAPNEPPPPPGEDDVFDTEPPPYTNPNEETNASDNDADLSKKSHKALTTGDGSESDNTNTFSAVPPPVTKSTKTPAPSREHAHSTQTSSTSATCPFSVVFNSITAPPAPIIASRPHVRVVREAPVRSATVRHVGTTRRVIVPPGVISGSAMPLPSSSLAGVVTPSTVGVRQVGRTSVRVR